MKKILLCLILSFITPALAAEDLSSFAAGLNTTLRFLNEGQGGNCTSTVLTNTKSLPVTLDKDKASVLTETDAQKLFNELKSNGEIPFDFSIAGCEERAHEMSRVMLLKGITPLKVFASVDENQSPRLRRPHPTKSGMTVDWKYHVAPVVLVRKGSELIPYVMDPSLETKAVPVSEWKATMTRHNPKMKVQLKFTPAAHYDEQGRLIVNFKDGDFNKSIQQTLQEYKIRSKASDGEDQLWFELQRDHERMMMIDSGGY